MCGSPQNARVYFPKGSGKYPAVSFAHGFLNGGTKAYSGYKVLHEHITEAGFVVIVNEANSPIECAEMWKDQFHGLEWLKSSELASKVDWSSKTGVYGHSLGGGATYHSAGLANMTKTYNVGAAVVLHPQITSPVPLQPIKNPVVPIMYASGSADILVLPGSVKSAYAKTSGVPKVFAEIRGATHFEPTMKGPCRMKDHIAAMFDCHLKGNAQRCSKVYGTNSDSLCAGGIPMTACLHENGPHSEVELV